MGHADTNLSVGLGWAAAYLTLSDFYHDGGHNGILKSFIADNRHIDPITTRQKQQFVNLADKFQIFLGISRVFGAAHITLESRDRPTDRIEDREITGRPGDERIDPEGKTSRVSRFQDR
jgi:hypothetical protein